MPRRHPRALHGDLPTRWLMTDERLGDDLWRALARLPRGGGIVFRHHATAADERRRLFRRVLRIARRRGLLLIRAGSVRFAGEMGVHAQRGTGVVTWPAHDRDGAIHAMRAGADVIFVSPVFATRSHPGAPAIGVGGAARIARGLPVAAIALGGMDERQFVPLRLRGFHGYAAIDAWRVPPRDQKRKAVPK